jgi:hypothetical protein
VYGTAARIAAVKAAAIDDELKAAELKDKYAAMKAAKTGQKAPKPDVKELLRRKKLAADKKDLLADVEYLKGGKVKDLKNMQDEKNEHIKERLIHHNLKANVAAKVGRDSLAKHAQQHIEKNLKKRDMNNKVMSKAEDIAAANIGRIKKKYLPESAEEDINTTKLNIYEACDLGIITEDEKYEMLQILEESCDDIE